MRFWLGLFHCLNQHSWMMCLFQSCIMFLLSFRIDITLISVRPVIRWSCCARILRWQTPNMVFCVFVFQIFQTRTLKLNFLKENFYVTKKLFIQSRKHKQKKILDIPLKNLYKNYLSNSENIIRKRS